ncbi:SIMPL domain-containing protein [Candidatus Planktophila vernalis]|uniref:SIMPL domain-containing protein n=1 Tax=Candidatus Planktophila vernalis TaxID=1884907 RepID=A0A249KUQ9_9ACTN|nr:SIMPL domain-containing protein [Candidatus Planktophila vernalis]ASY20487.1 SIMPL domain-containing protein [Candidatus Planktophila vernalis]
MKLKLFRIIASIITVSAVAGVVALAIPANGADTTNTRYITVTGVGTISVVPDAVRFNATVSSLASTNAAALSSASKSAAAVRAALKDKGIALKDIRSANISVYPEYNWTQEAGTKITGYRASQSFDVLVRKASDAGTIIEAVVTAGGDKVQLGGVIPTTLNPAIATEEARAAAVANAKSKASSYAKLLGTSIGKVLFLEEQSSPIYSSPFPMAKAEADSAVQIDLGEQDVTVTITVRWALN